MTEQLSVGMKRLDELAYTFARSQRLELDDLIYDDGVIMLNRHPHTIELRCSGKTACVHVSTDELVNNSVAAQHRVIMALMQFVPVNCP